MKSLLDLLYVQFFSCLIFLIAEGTIMILNGLFREGDLSIENKQVCLDILDKFAMVGWPKALDLLSSMERPDKFFLNAIM